MKKVSPQARYSWNDLRRQMIKYRKISHQTQEQMAHRLGVAFSTYSGWERRKRFPQQRHLGAIEDLIARKKNP